ncbi:MAG: hypothetical protein QOH91_1988, partial [Mycobacterium sp.]|nr:hypothetical protein [Mycobacterium sp.]
MNDAFSNKVRMAFNHLGDHIEKHCALGSLS